MNARLLGTGGLLLAVVLLFAVNIFSGAALSSARLDLTENKLYTLAKGTRSILAGLEEPVTLRFYLSQSLAARLPGISSYADRVRALLDEYEREGQGKLAVHLIDPEPFSEEEDRAVGYGLRGVPLEAEDETLYFGLVGTNSVDDEEVIPFFSTGREQFLEYDITKLVHRLGNPQRKVVGLLSTLRMDGMNPRLGAQAMMAPPWMVVEQMRQLFDVRTLNDDLEEVPQDIEVLMVVHPRELDEKALYAIDQFVVRGGHALVFVDPNSDSQEVMSMGGLPASTDRSSYFEKILGAWGVRLEPDTVVGDIDLAVEVRMERDRRMVTFEYPVWMNVDPSVDPAVFDHDDIVTAQLGNVSFGTPGSLVPVPGASTRFTPLVSTTPNAARFPVEKVSMGADPQDILRTYQPAGERLVLAARITGKVTSAFPDGAPAPREEGGTAGAAGAAPETGPERRAYLAESVGEVNVIVVADTDLLQDRFWVSVQDFLGSRLAIPTAANATLVVNAIDNLLGSTELISVRNRGSFVRPFDRVNKLRDQAELRFREKEQELIQRLEDTERKLVDLEQGKGGDDSAILTEAQRRELVEFRQEKVRIRKELRDVRRELRRNIEKLEASVKFANIGLVPILIGIGCLLAGIWHVRRHRPAAGGA